MNNDELLKRFECEHMDVNGITPDRRREQFRTLREYGELLGDRTLIGGEPADVLNFMGQQLKAELHVNTVRKHHGMIRAFHSWAFRVGLIDALTYTQLKAVPNPRGSSPQTKPKPYTAREIHEFYAIMQAKYELLPQFGQGSRLIRRYHEGKTRFSRKVWIHARRLQFEAQVSLALEEGLRRIELHRITIPQMHYDNQGVVVVTAKSEPGQVREREVPFTAHSRACVQDWLDFRQTLRLTHDSPWLTLDPWRDPMEPLGLQTLGETLAKCFGEKWKWHRFRHTFATERLRAKMPLEKLQIMLGHSTLEQTLAYAKILKSDIQEEAERTESEFAERLGLVA